MARPDAATASLYHRPTAAQTTASLYRRCLCVSLLFRASNWLQGPYFYIVYSALSCVSTVEEGGIGIRGLYLVGYLSSMIAGTLVGGLTDWWGRRAGCMLCGAVYVAACLSVHVDSLPLVVVGRACGGVGSTLLHTAFESWLNTAYGRATAGAGEAGAGAGAGGRAAVPLSSILASQTFWGGVVAVVAGLVASATAGIFGGAAVFDLAAAFALAGSVCAFLLWDENYGGTEVEGHGRGQGSKSQGSEGPGQGKGKGAAVAASTKTKAGGSVAEVFVALRERPSLLLVGLLQALFEGSMHVFVLLWSPVLMHVVSECTKECVSECERLWTNVNEYERL